jgi:hypothetical protein
MRLRRNGARAHARPFVDERVNGVQTADVVESSEWTAIEQVVGRLQESYPAVSADTGKMVVRQHHARFDGRPIRDYVPLFVERDSRRELAELGC